jgi:energy-coupling factor transport system permease protein
MRMDGGFLPALHRIDPRTKLTLCVSYCIHLALQDSFAGLLTSSIPVVGTALFVGIPWIRLFRSASKLRWFIAAIVLVNLLTVDGLVLFTLGDVYGTKEGLLQGFGLSLRIILLLWCSQLLVWTTPPTEVVDSMETFLRPLRNLFGNFLMILRVTFNFVPMFVEVAYRLGLGFRARGIDIDSSPIKRLKYLSSAAGPLFTISSRMAEHLATAMEARCYDPSQNRTTYTRLKFGVTDWGVASVSLLLLLATFVLRW